MREHTLPDGRLVRYEHRADAPVGAPATVVFLNGLSQTTVAWGLLAKRLRGVRDVLLYDAAGQGRSSPPPPGSRPEHHAGDLLHLLESLGIGRVDLVGFSFGSRIALRLALREPGRVRRLVLIGCAHRETVLRRWIVQGWLDALDAGGLDLCHQIVTPDVVGERWLAANEHQREHMLRAFRRRNEPASMRRLLQDTLLEGGGLLEELRSLSHPTLVLRGAADPLVPAALNEELCELLPDARLEHCPEAGHTVAVEDPEWTWQRLEAHLLGGGRPGRGS